VRLYRGLKEPHRPEKVVSLPGQRDTGTDFTDCPLAALRYANARRGVVLILDVPPDTLKVSEELWLGMGNARRYMVWGRFDKFIIAVLPAKELRALIRVMGVAGATDEYKALVLRRKIQERLDHASREPRSGSASDSPVGLAVRLPGPR
jgi:hypothetical protein